MQNIYICVFCKDSIHLILFETHPFSLNRPPRRAAFPVFQLIWIGHWEAVRTRPEHTIYDNLTYPYHEWD